MLTFKQERKVASVTYNNPYLNSRFKIYRLKEKIKIDLKIPLNFFFKTRAYLILNSNASNNKFIDLY